MTSPQSVDVQLATMRGQLDTVVAKLDAIRDAAGVQTAQAQRTAEEAKGIALATERDGERALQAQRDDFDRKLSVVRVDLEAKIGRQGDEIGTRLNKQADELGARLDRMSGQIGQLLDFKSAFRAYGLLVGALGTAAASAVAALVVGALK